MSAINTFASLQLRRRDGRHDHQIDILVNFSKMTKIQRNGK